MYLLYLDRHLCLFAIGSGHCDDGLALLDCRYNAVGVNCGNSGVGGLPAQRCDCLCRGQLHLRAEVLRRANLHRLGGLGDTHLRRVGVHGNGHSFPNTVGGQHIDLAAARAYGFNLTLGVHSGHRGIAGDIPQLGDVVFQLALLHSLYGSLNALRLAELDRHRRGFQRQAAGIGDLLRAIAGVGVNRRAAAQHILLVATVHDPGAYISLVALILGKVGHGIASWSHCRPRR